MSSANGPGASTVGRSGRSGKVAVTRIRKPSRRTPGSSIGWPNSSVCPRSSWSGSATCSAAASTASSTDSRGATASSLGHGDGGADRLGEAAVGVEQDRLGGLEEGDALVALLGVDGDGVGAGALLARVDDVLGRLGGLEAEGWPGGLEVVEGPLDVVGLLGRGLLGPDRGRVAGGVVDGGDPEAVRLAEAFLGDLGGQLAQAGPPRSGVDQAGPGAGVDRLPRLRGLLHRVSPPRRGGRRRGGAGRDYLR